MSRECKECGCPTEDERDELCAHCLRIYWSEFWEDDCDGN